MKLKTRIVFLNDRNEKFFGEGPAQLMHALERCGSLRAAAASMDLSYSKAFRIIKNAEEALGFPITEKTTGGKNGGGSRITPEGAAWLKRYEAFRDACAAENQKLFDAYYADN